MDNTAGVICFCNGDRNNIPRTESEDWGIGVRLIKDLEGMRNIHAGSLQPFMPWIPLLWTKELGC